MREVYYAKSADECGHQVTNQEHLNAVAELARRFGTEVDMPKCAKTAGQLHDFGKYSEAFQNVLKGTATSVDHAVCAAAYLYGSGKTAKPAYRMIAEAAAAHHSVLQSFGLMEAELRDICRGEGSGVCWSGKKSALFGPKQFMEAQRAFSRDFSDFKISAESFDDTSADGKMLRERMLFSCLVDADYTASSGRSADEGAALDPKALLSRLYDHMDELRKGSESDRALNRIRDKVFRRCGEAGDMAPGVFTLTAPTGVGKTMALLHFALRHCIAHSKRRIILVLPFLTLTEQSQREYGKLIDNTLSDHSQSRLSEEERELVSRWDSPFIITTSVRFFESLFSAHPKDCRKLHNIAQSVILFDEAQSLPANLATATMRAARALCDDYGCSLVFSTATQPDFSALPKLDNWRPREILSRGERYYSALKRTRVRWLLGRPTALEDIADEMAQKNSVCAIVNLRRHAVRLFEALKSACPGDERDSLFFLTTDLCPKHRSEIIDTIKERLSKGIACRVVATQCIEAGVDLDFAAMYRALAPLEAIIQAAGRCNRNGSIPGGGLVTVFIPEDTREIYPGGAYRNAAMEVKKMCASGELDIHDPETIAEYYRRLFGKAEEKETLTKAISSEDYEAVEREYKLIEKQGVQVVVPYDKALFDEILRQADTEGVTPSLIKKAAPITVSSFSEDLVRKHCEQIPYRKRCRDAQTESDFYILTAGHEKYYLPDMGLQLIAPEIDDGMFMP